MTRVQAQRRNHDILQLRGIYNRLYGLIPDDVKIHMNQENLALLPIIMDDLRDALLKAKKPKEYSADVCMDCFHSFYSETHYLYHQAGDQYCDHCNNYNHIVKIKRNKKD